VNNQDSELLDRISRLAATAEGLFVTHAELSAWLACALRRRRHGETGGSAQRCDEVAAAACAIGFNGECPLASTPIEFDFVTSRLPTARLEALLRLAEGGAPA
jgi:hypothetical protein